LGQHRVGHLRPTKLTRHADTPQAAVGIQVHDVGGHLAGTVAFGVLLKQHRCNTMSHGDSLDFVANQFGMGRMDRVIGRYRQCRHTTLSGEWFVWSYCSFCAAS